MLIKPIKFYQSNQTLQYTECLTHCSFFVNFSNKIVKYPKHYGTICYLLFVFFFFGIYSTPKLSKNIALVPVIYKAIK